MEVRRIMPGDKPNPKKSILVAERTSSFKGNQIPSNAHRGICNKCKEEILVMPGSPDCVKMVCTECCPALLEELGDVSSGGFSSEQIEEIKALLARAKDGNLGDEYDDFDGDIIKLANEKQIGVADLLRGCTSALVSGIRNGEMRVPEERRGEYLKDAVHVITATLFTALGVDVDFKHLKKHLEQIQEAREEVDGRPANAKLN